MSLLQKCYPAANSSSKNVSSVQRHPSHRVAPIV